MINRRFARMHAIAFGYFWLPCPACGQMFSGWEWSRSMDLSKHLTEIPSVDNQPTGGQGICPDCVDQGVGCRAWASNDRYKKIHPGCEFA